jgi:hypothetical protein
MNYSILTFSYFVLLITERSSRNLRYIPYKKTPRTVRTGKQISNRYYNKCLRCMMGKHNNTCHVK